MTASNVVINLYADPSPPAFLNVFWAFCDYARPLQTCEGADNVRNYFAPTIDPSLLKLGPAGQRRSNVEVHRNNRVGLNNFTPVITPIRIVQTIEDELLSVQFIKPRRSGNGRRFLRLRANYC